MDARTLGRSRVLFGRAIVAAALVAAAPLPALAAPASPFVAVDGGVWNANGDVVVPEVLQSAASGPLSLVVGGLPSAFGQFRSDYGSNGFDIQVTGGIDREVDGGSIWTDAFTVTSGTGSGLLSISAQIHGAMVGQAEMGYALFVSDQPFDLQTIVDSIAPIASFATLQLPGATRYLFAGATNRCPPGTPTGDCEQFPLQNFEGSLDLTLGADVPFTYGQTFYVASLFEGGVSQGGGSASFINSADFGISVPAGAALQAQSGTAYAAAVPESSSWLLLLLGLASMALRAACRPRRG